MINQVKNYLRKNKRLLLFHLVVNGLIALFISGSSYVHVPLTSAKGIISYLFHFILLQFTIFGFTYLLALNKYIFYSVFSILFVFFSFIGFWGYTQDVVVTDGVIQSSLEVKSNIFIELFNVYIVGYLLLSIIALYFIIRQYRKVPQKFNFLVLGLALIAIGVFYYMNSIRYKTLSSRLPYSVVDGFMEYAEKPSVIFNKVPKNLIAEERNINVIFILGESVRADHLGLNGYERNTTPLLSKNKSVISFKNLHTTRYFSAISIPQILSDEPMDKPNITRKTSLVDVLNSAGIHTYWIANQVSEVSFDYHIQRSKTHTFIDPFHSVFSYKKASDLEMLPYLKDALKDDKQKFILLHMMGSHWMYSMRYDKSFKKFTPTAESKYIPSNTKNEMINAYDNTLLVLDKFIDEVIQQVEAKKDKSVVIYLSDHGELLGEDGQYLHANSGEPVLNPAGLIWFSPKLKAAEPALFENMQKMVNKKIELDFLYPTILDLFQIKGLSYVKEKSILGR